MKFSEAMLKGFHQVGGKQYFAGTFIPIGEDGTCPTRVCVLGAVNLGEYGDAERSWPCNGVSKFIEAWGLEPDKLNDEGMPWQHIYGMAVAAGL